jgi:ABC-type nitrate/sulfonate/bicarbonate transport system substrate-binding protein
MIFDVEINSAAHYPAADVPGLIVDCIAARTSVIRDRRADVKAFVVGWRLGQDRWRAEPERMRAVVAKELGVAPSEVDTVGMLLLGREENRKRFTGNGPTSLATVGQSYASFFGRMGMLRNRFRIEALLDSTFLP